MPSFDAITIIVTVPAASGVYRINNAGGQCIYVGESNNIKDRLLAHARKQTPQSICIHLHRPHTFEYEEIDGAVRTFVESGWISIYRPLCNR